jgi:hypothetical protein
VEHKYVVQIGEQLYGINYPDEDHLLFAYMGHTLTEIQVFESMLCFTLSAIMKDSEAKANFDEAMEKNTSKTLGQIANIVKTYLKDSELSDLLIAVKNKRNYFVHGFLRNYGWPMLGDKKQVREAKYIKAIEEMELLQKDMREVHRRLGKHVAENKLANIGYATITKEGEIDIIAENFA